MNERIRELIDECTATRRFSFEGTGGGYDEIFFNEKKFAELIIQDCINICRQEWFDENNKPTIGLPSRDIAIHLGEKLGIERCVDALIRKMK